MKGLYLSAGRPNMGIWLFAYSGIYFGTGGGAGEGKKATKTTFHYIVTKGIHF
jgi:hypothetical protein